MASLTSRIKEALNEGASSQKKTSVQVRKGTAFEEEQEIGLGVSRQEQTSYEEFKHLWEKRSAVTQTQPYIDHIELFLGLIEPEYDLEIQRAVASQVIEGQEYNFTVPKSEVNFNFQLTDDKRENINGEMVSNPFAVKALYGKLQDHFKTLFLKNIRGANPCIAINKLKGAARSAENIESIRAVWIEDDTVRSKPRTAVDDENPLPLPPSFIVESSKGKFHYYWLTATDEFNTWRRIQKEVMSDRLGSDPGANGLNRAMRIPGFWHSKTKPFPTRIVYLLGQNSIPITAVPSEAFLTFAETHQGAHKEYAYETYLAGQVKRYTWEEIMDAFGKFLPERPPETEYGVSQFSPIDTMERIFAAEDYHSSLHALCMHFANFQQDPEYITYIAQSLMCRVPERKRDHRWHSRFNDIPRSAQAAVTKKLMELASETQLSDSDKHQVIEKSLHDEDWPLAFPDISGGCKPLDMLMEDFASNSNKPIKPFNFAAAMSFFTLCLQNIPIMPVMGERTANGCHLLLAPSTDGKDLAVSMPIKSLTRALKSGYLSETDLSAREVLQGLEPTGEITSLSAFQQWAESPWRVKGGIWINTECTGQIGKMSDENLNVANLAEVVINIQDGTAIPTVTKAAKKSDQTTISKPLHEAYTLLFATQPASIKKYMTPTLLYKGVIGRFDYYISDQPPVSPEDQASTLSVETLRKYKFRPEILEFLAWMLRQCCIQRENCMDGHTRRVQVLYDESDVDNDEALSNGPRRQKHVDWDLKCKRNPDWQVDDSQFKTFIDRVPMSTERWATILSAVQHLWECFNKKVVPFQDPIIMTDEILDTACKLGEYQYDVRFFRIWPLIGSTRGLDDKHKTVLEAIQKADRNLSKWLKFVSQNQRQAHKVLFEKEFYIPVRAVARLIPYDANIPTKDLIPICLTLSSMGLVDFVQVKQMDARVFNKPLRNVVRLTSEGRL